MGSGSSKNNAQNGSPVQGGRKTAVTSVNTVTQASQNADDSKRDSKQPLGYSTQNTHAREGSRTERNANGRNHDRSTPIGDRIQGDSFDDRLPSATGHWYGSEVDGAADEVDDVLDEVLRIPVDTRSPARPAAAASGTQEPHGEGGSFPETYAQRRQREQYTLNQQLLLREKTIYRNPRDWQEEKPVEDVLAAGFDASKFRMVNQGKCGALKDNISSSKDDFTTSSCSETTYNWDDLEVTPKSETLSDKLPVYDETDMDILASLEKEFL